MDFVNRFRMTFFFLKWKRIQPCLKPPSSNNTLWRDSHSLGSHGICFWYDERFHWTWENALDQSVKNTKSTNHLGIIQNRPKSGPVKGLMIGILELNLVGKIRGSTMRNGNIQRIYYSLWYIYRDFYGELYRPGDAELGRSFIFVWLIIS